MPAWQRGISTRLWPPSSLMSLSRAIPAEADSYATYRFDPVEFRDFTTPTVLLLGSASGPVVQGWVQDLQAALSSSRIVLLEGQGHGAMHEAPELFVRTVRAALE
jgi:pimeloyl-ACP methyl ester carboxylesterase